MPCPPSASWSPSASTENTFGDNGLVPPPPGLEAVQPVWKTMSAAKPIATSSGGCISQSPNSITAATVARDLRWQNIKSLDAEMEKLQNNHVEEQGNSRVDDVMDSSNPLYLQSWLELERLTVWPVEKKIPKTRDNNARNVRVHFADENNSQLAEIRHVEESKRRSHPCAWFWFAVEEEEEARQWPYFAFHEGWNCWIVHNEVPQNTQQPPKVQPLASENALQSESEKDVCKELVPTVGNAPEVTPVEEALDSDWCEGMMKRLKDENPVVRDTGLAFLLSNDTDMCDSENILVTPKNGDVIMQLALSPHGYRVIQEALMVAPRKFHDRIISALHGHVQELVASPHGCEVLETLVEYAEASNAVFVVKELEGSVCALARAPEKFQLIQRLLEHLPASTEGERELLVKELLAEMPALCRHARGNHVVQHLLEYGSQAQQEQICVFVADNLLSLARHRIAGHVVEKAVDASDFTASSFVAQAALSQEGVLLALACNRQSQFVAQRLAKRPGPQGDAIRRVLCANMQQLQASKYGSRIADTLTNMGALLSGRAGA